MILKIEGSQIPSNNSYANLRKNTICSSIFDKFYLQINKNGFYILIYKDSKTNVTSVLELNEKNKTTKLLKLLELLDLNIYNNILL